MTDNEIIAEFMGLKQEDGKYLIHDFPHIHASMYCSAESLDFHRSWDWLMPVVEKIDYIWTDAEGDSMIEAYAETVIKMYITCPIESVHKRAVTFIKWYNTQNPKQG